jgi:aspartyl-tRNA(Asn)/glutamyl-tRNA(Gln) amidotransferase subunit B
MRTKEDAHDYRYFPDPDLLPLVLTDEFIKHIQATLPELPDEKRLRFINCYGLSNYDVGVLVAEKARADFYEAVVRRDNRRDPKIVANWLITELLGGLNRSGLDIQDSPITPAQLGGLIDLVSDGTLSGRLAKEVLADMLISGRDAALIVEEKGLCQIIDTKVIEAVVIEVLKAQPAKVAEYRAGKAKLFSYFVGQVMKATNGRASPLLVNKILKFELDE